MASYLQGSRPALTACLLSFGLILPAAAVAKDWTSLRVIVQDGDGEPVSRASVILSRLKKSKKTKIKGDALQLKTSQQGTAPLPPLEQGRYMLQVISQGYQTHGDEIVLDEAEQTVTVTLKPPQDQFSVHEDKP